MIPLDDKSNEILAQIYPDVAKRWILCREYMNTEHGILIRLTEGLRTMQTQLQYWSKGRTKTADGHWMITNPKQLVTHAYPGQSLHQFGLALDICIAGSDPYPIDHTVWEKYGDILKAHGLTWGGDWTGADCDQPHCEDKYGFTLFEIQSFYSKSNNIKDVWDMCDTRLMGEKV